MKNILKRDKISSIIWNVIILIQGLLLCLLRGKALGVLESIISTTLIVYGIVSIILFYFTPDSLKDNNKLVVSIILLVTGAILDFVPSLFIVVFGFIILLAGLKEITYGLELKKFKDTKWWFDFVCGCVLFCLGLVVVVLCNTSVASNIVSIMLGISLIINGIINLLLILVLHREFNRASQTIKESDEGFTDYTIK